MLSITLKEVKALQEVVNMFMPDEVKHWEESGKPKNHIYHSLKTLRRLVDVAKKSQTFGGRF